MRIKKPYLGATGKFPHGKLNKDDEGELAMKVGVQNGKVVLDFGKEIAWLGMNPQDAADLASLLLKHARTAAAVSGTPIEFTIG